MTNSALDYDAILDRIDTLPPNKRREAERLLLSLKPDEAPLPTLEPMVQYQADPERFFTEQLGIPANTVRWSLNPGYEGRVWDGTPEPLIAILTALCDWQDVCVEAGTGTQKSYTAAAAILWWLACWKESRAFTFAPKEEQLRAFIWMEIGKLWPRFALLFPTAVLTDLRIQMRGTGDKAWGAQGYSVGMRAGEEISTKAQGMHAEHQLLIYEEAPGVALAVIEAGENTSTAPHNLRMALGNPDHCFVAGTQVKTRRGSVPIEGVTTSDEVLTRVGYRRVLRSGLTRSDAPTMRVLLSDGTSLRGTRDHPIYVPCSGFTRLDTLRSGTVLLGAESWLRKSYLTVSSFGGILTRLGNQIGGIFDQVFMIPGCCTAPYGLLPTVQFQTAMMFTTSTKIPATTRSTTSNASRKRSTVSVTDQPTNFVRMQHLFGRWLGLGILPLLGRSGTERTGHEGGSDSPTTITFARSAVGRFRAAIFARIRRAIVGPSVVSVSTVDEREPVYDLTVEGQHEFFASGVLVHNCLDSLHLFGYDQFGVKRLGVTCVRISALDHPNIVTGNASVVPGAVSAKSIDRRLAKYGVDDRIYQSRVRGISPSEAADALIKLEWVQRAQLRWKTPADRTILEAVGFGRKSLGVDVANSESGDEAAISRWKGAVCTEVPSFPCPNSNNLGLKVFLEMQEQGINDDTVGVDNVGVGAGTANELMNRGRYVRSLNGGASPTGSLDDEQWNNLRSQMHWTLREDLRLDKIALPPDPELAQDLVTPTYETKNGKICVESKEEIKKRTPGGRSPNKGDAVAYGNFVRPRDAVVTVIPKRAPTLSERVMKELQALDTKPTGYRGPKGLRQ